MNRVSIFVLSLAALGAPAFQAAAAEPAAQAAKPNPAAPEVFAVVGDTVISAQDYQNHLNAKLRQTFYHGKIPEGQEAVVKKEVGDALINRALLLQEAKRRGIVADKAKVDAEVAKYDARYKGSPQWTSSREKLLPGLTAQIEEQALLEQLESKVRVVPEPKPAEVKKFYEAKPDLFTEPEKTRMSVILLKVDPSSPKAAWDKAREEAKAILERLRKGADFAETAKLHSADESAARGGDMGYLHKGMLPEGTQLVVDGLATGAVSEPVDLLEGVALLRVDERIPAKKRAFDEVSERAAALLKRENSEQAWNDLIKELRAKTPIRIDSSRFPEMSAGATAK